MAKAKLVALAEEIKDDLRKKAWSLKFDPERTYKPNPELKDTDHLTVLVGMPETEMVPDDRSTWLYEHSIEIGVQFRGKPEGGVPTDKFDECMKLVEEIADNYRFYRPTTSNVVLQAVTFPHGAYILSHINELNQFTGVVRLTFREWRT